MRLTVRVFILIICVQVFGEKYLSTAQAVANERTDPQNTVNPLMERINQIRATLMALLQYKVSRLQQQMVPLVSPTNSIATSILPQLSALQPPPRPYIAQTIIGPPPPPVGPGSLWLAQAGLMLPQPGLSPAAAFRPIAQFAFSPPAHPLAVAAPLVAQMAPAALAAALNSLQQGLPSPIPLAGVSLTGARPPLTGSPLPLPGSLAATPQTTPGLNLGQSLGAITPTNQLGGTLGQLLGAMPPTTQLGGASGRPIGTNLPTTQTGAALGATQPINQLGTALGLGATQAISQLGAALGQGATQSINQLGAALGQGATQPLSQLGAALSQGATQPINQLGTALGQGATQPISQLGAALGQPLGTNLPTSPLGSLGLPSVPALLTARPGSLLGQAAAAVSGMQQSSPLPPLPGAGQLTPPTAPTTPARPTLANGLPNTQAGGPPQQEQLVNVVPVPQPGSGSQQALPQGSLPSVPRPTVPTQPAAGTPGAQFDDRSNPKPLLLV